MSVVGILNGGEEPVGHEFAVSLDSSHRGPTADYRMTIRSPMPLRGQVVAELDAYPRWTEPGIALFARLLQCGRQDLLLQDASSAVHLAFMVGEQVEALRAVEVMNWARTGSRVDVLFASEMSKHHAYFDTMSLRPSLRTVVLAGIRSCLGWSEFTPELPPPLSDVPIRPGSHGRLVVRLEDVPLYPRTFVRLRHHLPTEQRELEAEHWRAFIGLNQGASTAFSGQ